ncbi:YaaR family protein [Domibacillus sp. DTU_2020_1001157_1_SI_ALB_TIR_016]|uniref:YaaR family protein n=1 Tax=Domibacillus sp. DTU_2020_1001157_1_SI_ALB_TIR_016 TaxID=3077789 RepID=UPI0028EB1E0A|nr:YaaR family protein [Domibacillus sp. DTU_2020_1001157_1_SI_ALB_TIR_016]WNS81295.1 YaaR family protein [Domibacillus sp. DTU_2020_1001157_1_SI_ALB_TIR_016]
MEIQRVNKVSASRTERKEETAKASVTFTDVIANKRQNAALEKMNRMVKDIEVQGEKLAEHRTIDDLRKYKKMVKEFMQEAVDSGLQLEEQRGFNRRGRTKVYKIVKEVDSRLTQLANDVINKEKSQLDILSKVGEIQGLLVNIYT